MKMLTEEKDKIELKIRHLDKENMTELGEGEFGTVYLDESNEDEEEVIKILKIPK